MKPPPLRYDDVSDAAQLCRVAGVALVSRQKSLKAQVTRVMSVTIANHRGLTLIPGINDKIRRIHINGALVGDVPVRLTINGLEAYELPAIGNTLSARVFPVDISQFILVAYRWSNFTFETKILNKFSQILTFETTN